MRYTGAVNAGAVHILAKHNDRPHDDRKGHHYYTRNTGTGVV